MFQNKASAFTPDPSHANGDDLGPYPADVDNNPTRQRVLERALRAVTIVAVVECLVVVALICCIVAIFPLKEVYPYLVTFRDNQQQIVGIEPLSKSAPGIEFATEANVRDYVTQRHSFFPINSRMDEMWGPDSRLAAMSSLQEYGEFQDASKIERTRMMDSGYTRQIRIESATMIRPDTWQVNFTSFDSLGGAGGTLTGSTLNAMNDSDSGKDIMTADLTPKLNARNWLATMTIEYEPSRVSYDKRLLNPLGFTVTDYSVTARK